MLQLLNMKDGVAIRTSSKTPTFPLMVDTSVYSTGDELHQVAIIGGGFC